MPAFPASAALNRRSFLSAGTAALAALATGAAANDDVERPDLDDVFKAQRVTGAFALFEAKFGRLTLVNAERARRRYVPASTFKIANSIIALETRVIRDENEVIPYGGKPQPFPAWEKDMPMREAITASSVPIYQELARRIGFDNYRRWLTRLDYGNYAIGTNVETFWLDGPLEISAVEQAKFAVRLAQQKLPASPRTQGIVRDILRLEEKNGRTLYGKTGWRFSSKPQLGWWTGWVEHDDAVTGFALNMDLTSAPDAAKRVTVGKTLLERLNIY